MTNTELVGKLRDVMKRSSPADVAWDSVDESATIESLGIDSLSMLDLIYDLQQEFDIEFEAEDLLEVRTVGELTAFLDQRIGS